MGKKSRKTKAKTSDFQKVKLKVGKKRPLPTNVTEVAFKSQAIYIPEQLKNVGVDETTADDAFSGRKKNILELLNQVGHFNANFRTDALTALRLSFSNNKQLILKFLPKIIENIPKTIADEDQQVRKSCISLFKLVFSHLSESEISPFLDIILSHLYCAMTHIYDDVQKDSLQIVDLCIEYFPNLLTPTTRGLLLQHFIDLISTKQNKSAANNKNKQKDSTATRVLSMKLSNKESSITWRNRVLKRLHDLLNISPKSEEKSEKLTSWFKHVIQSDNTEYSHDEGVLVASNSDDISTILTSFESQKFTLPKFSIRSTAMRTVSSLDKSCEEFSPWNMIATLFPLLFDCWHEAVSDNSKPLTQDSITTKCLVLKIMNVLLKRFINSSDDKLQAVSKVRNSYLNSFRQYFFQPFPFATNPGRQRVGKKRKLVEETKMPETSTVQDINISVCELLTIMIPKEYIGADAELLSTSAEHLSMLVLLSGSGEGENLTSDALERCIDVIKKLIQNASDEATVESLLHPLYLLYEVTHYNSAVKTKILNFFMEIYCEPRRPVDEDSVLSQWLCSIPGLLSVVLSQKAKASKPDEEMGTLCSDSRASDIVLSLLSCIRISNFHKNSISLDKMSVVIEIVQKSSESIFCSPNIESKKNVCMTCNKIQARFFEVLMSHTMEISDSDVTNLAHICHLVSISPKNVTYAVEMMFHRYSRTKMPQDFLKMMQFSFSVLMGVSKQLLSSFQSLISEQQSYKVIYDDRPMRFHCHKQVVDNLCLILPTIENIATLLSHFICEKIMNTYKTLPSHLCYAIMKSGLTILSFGDFATTELEELCGKLGGLAAAVLLNYHTPSEELVDNEIRQTLVSNSVSLMQRRRDILDCCIKNMAQYNFQSANNLEATCLSIQYLVSSTDLHEHLQECTGEIESLMEKIKAAGPDVVSNPVFESTWLQVSLLLRIDAKYSQ